MITCSSCGQLFITCETQSMGMNLHTKIEGKNKITVIPEYYQISDSGSQPKLACLCKKLDIAFHCDYCGRPVTSKTIKVIEDKHGKKLFSCLRCIEDKPASTKITDEEIDNFKFDIKA